MSRKSVSKKRANLASGVRPDPVYDSLLVSMLINRILKRGKKTLAQRIFDQAMEEIKLSTNQDPLKVLKVAILKITPVLEVKSKRVGGSTYQVPKEVSVERGTTLALRWLLQAAKNRPDRGMALKLANEIIDASKETGNAVRKKDETHRMAEANKAFAHYRF